MLPSTFIGPLALNEVWATKSKSCEINLHFDPLLFRYPVYCTALHLSSFVSLLWERPSENVAISSERSIHVPVFCLSLCPPPTIFVSCCKQTFYQFNPHLFHHSGIYLIRHQSQARHFRSSSILPNSIHPSKVPLYTNTVYRWPWEILRRSVELTNGWWPYQSTAARSCF